MLLIKCASIHREFGLDYKVKVYNTLLRSSSTGGAKPSLALFSTMLSTFRESGDVERALAVMNDMNKLKVTPDVVCFKILLNLLTEVREKEI
jgi:pentatricopeptide repeat protein